MDLITWSLKITTCSVIVAPPAMTDMDLFFSNTITTASIV